VQTSQLTVVDRIKTIAIAVTILSMPSGYLPIT